MKKKNGVSYKDMKKCKSLDEFIGKKERKDKKNT